MSQVVVEEKAGEGIKDRTFQEKVDKNRKERSDYLTQQAKLISLGIIALCWAFIIGELPEREDFSISTVNLLGPALFALLAILLDHVHFLFGYWCDLKLLQRFEKTSEANPKYDRNSFGYKMTFRLFYAKQISTLIASVWFILAVLNAFLSAS